MTKKECGNAAESLRVKLANAKAACAAFSCLKQAMIEVPGVQNAVRKYWPTMLDVWQAKDAKPKTLDEGLSELDRLLEASVYSLKEEIDAWECGDWGKEQSNAL